MSSDPAVPKIALSSLRIAATVACSSTRRVAATSGIVSENNAFSAIASRRHPVSSRAPGSVNRSIPIKSALMAIVVFGSLWIFGYCKGWAKFCHFLYLSYSK